MILVSRIQREVVHIRTDATAQLELAGILFEVADTVNRIGAFLAGGPRRLVFSEQNLTALQRLIGRGERGIGLEALAAAVREATAGA